MLKHLMEYIDFNDIDTYERPSDPLTDKRFVKFLNINGIYDKFMDNLYRAIEQNDGHYRRNWYSIKTFCDDISKTEGRYKYITLAFYWSNTLEGYEFWEYWHSLWVTWSEFIS